MIHFHNSVLFCVYRSRQSESRSMSTESPAMVVPTGSAPNAEETDVKDDKALDELLNFNENM